MQAREHLLKTKIAPFGLILGISALLALSSGCAPTNTGAGCGENRTSLVETATLLPSEGCAWVIFGEDTVVTEVAATTDERAKGLKYRDEVPDGTGMLFVFQETQTRAFWMANTFVALDIAYMDPSYRIVDIVAMEPEVRDLYPSAAPSMFGLEVRKGWFAEKGIEIGDQAEIVFGGQHS